MVSTSGHRRGADIATVSLIQFDNDQTIIHY